MAVKTTPEAERINPFPKALTTIMGVKAIKRPKLAIIAKPTPHCSPFVSAIRLFGPNA